MTYTPEQLREWAEYLAGRGSVWTLPDGIPKPSDLFRAHADALEELARLRSRLEIDFVTDGNGKRVPFPEGGPDGIACRDETIRLLEAALAYVRKTLDEVRPGMDTGAPIEAIVREVVAALAESERKCERLKAMLHSLHALVWGECPSLLNEDSGGSGHLDADIRAEFKEDKP